MISSTILKRNHPRPFSSNKDFGILDIKPLKQFSSEIYFFDSMYCRVLMDIGKTPKGPRSRNAILDDNRNIYFAKNMIVCLGDCLEKKGSVAFEGGQET